MKKIVVAISLVILGPIAAHSQLYMTRTGFVGFYPKLPWKTSGQRQPGLRRH